MASGSIQFSVSANPIDGLNARLKALGRKEVITSINSSSEPYGCINRNIYYRYADGKRSNYKYLQQPTDSPDALAEKFLTHLRDSEYQQYLDDHKAMTLGSLFGENRFPRARERAFLDFRTLAASQTRYESFDYSDPHSGVVKKILDAYLTHHLPDLSSIKVDVFATVEHGHAVVQMYTPMPDWRKCRTIQIPLSQDMPWYTAAQQARDTLRAWIDAEVKNGKSSFKPEMSIAAAQKIPAGAMVNSDGEVVGKATPARAMAYMNGTPMGVLTGIDYSGIVRLNTDGEGRVTTTTQQVREAIDRSNAISVPTEKEIERRMIEHVMRDVPRFVPSPTSEALIRSVAASTHETYKAMERLGQDMRAGFEQSRMQFDNLASQPLTRDGFHSVLSRVANVTAGKDDNFVMSLETQLPQPPASVNIPLDFAPQIGDDSSVSKPLWPTTHELGRMTVQERTVWSVCVEHSLDAAKRGGPAPPQDLVAYFKETASMPTLGVNVNDPTTLRQRATAEAIEVAYRTAAIKLPDLVRKQLVKRMASKGGKAKPSQARLSLAEEMLSGDEGSLIVAGILSLALSASPEFIKSKMPWLDLDRLARELRLNVETRIACAVADMLGMYLEGALEALKEAFGGSQQLLLAEGGKSDESALFNGVPKAETVGVR